MERDFRVARACVSEAIRDFHFREYAPFAWILGGHLLFILLAMFLEATPAMATVGALTRAIYGDSAVHYPTFYLFLPSLAAIAEGFLYSVPAAVLIPLSIILTVAPMERHEERSEPVGDRLRRAWLPTLLVLVGNVGLLWGWQWIFQNGPAPLITRALPGFLGAAIAWFVGVLGAYAIAAVFIYVPIVAIRRGSTFGSALSEGLREGLGLFRFTLFFIFLFALPVLPVLLIVQSRPAFIVSRMRPELIPLALMVYAVLISAATYLTYAAAARLHWSGDQREQI
jgi:hypothetical protein